MQLYDMVFTVLYAYRSKLYYGHLALHTGSDAVFLVYTGCGKQEP